MMWESRRRASAVNTELYWYCRECVILQWGSDGEDEGLVKWHQDTQVCSMCKRTVTEVIYSFILPPNRAERREMMRKRKHLATHL